MSLAFSSDINSISDPKHFNPTLSGFLSLMKGIFSFVSPKCCKIILPLVLAPKAKIFLFEFKISFTNLRVLFFKSETQPETTYKSKKGKYQGQTLFKLLK